MPPIPNYLAARLGGGTGSLRRHAVWMGIHLPTDALCGVGVRSWYQQDGTPRVNFDTDDQHACPACRRILAGKVA